MAIGLIGIKVGMTQMFSPDGEVLPVTILEVGPCSVVQKKTVEKDGYAALQLGYQEKKAEKISKPLQGHFKKAGRTYGVLREFRTEQTEAYKVGDLITVEIFGMGEKVQVCGVSKGKGFAGNIKRWGFHRGPMTHGSKFHRAVGSSGMSAWPSKVLRGKKMPGQLGSERITARRLEIIDKRDEENLIMIRGAIPGGKNGIVMISKL